LRWLISEDKKRTENAKKQGVLDTKNPSSKEAPDEIEKESQPQEDAKKPPEAPQSIQSAKPQASLGK